MRLYNTLSRKKEEFKPVTEGQVKMYSCGPTVYNYFHVGNARPFIIFDTLRRYLEYSGYKVDYVQNFTDIDDKMINKANELEITIKELADKFIEEYYKDAKGLGIKEATLHPKATENIDAIIDLIKTLQDKGYAYEAEGDVYFSTKKFEQYGKLSHYKLDELESGVRVAIDERKKEAVDFALWKAQKTGEPAWDSPWGKGRPGWHIECSAMANKYLGETIDIHSGGLDLIFPHHENEIAQSEAANGKPFANYWIHNGFINVDNEKMSKSAGNFFTVRDIVNKFDYDVIRFFMLSAHYRSPINFSDTLLEAAQNGLERIKECKKSLEFLKKHAISSRNNKTHAIEEANVSTTSDKQATYQDFIDKLEIYKNKFINSMEDDLNTADAIAAIFELVKEINITLISTSAKDIYMLELAENLLIELTGVLGILFENVEQGLDSTIEELIEQRQQARKNKSWAEADKIRDQLKEMGIELQDTPQGIKWTRR